MSTAPISAAISRAIMPSRGTSRRIEVRARPRREIMLPAAVHAAAHAIKTAMGNVGQTVSYTAAGPCRRRTRIDRARMRSLAVMR